MKKDLKADILETARRLFNERGYNGVSMRDVAGELGISVGNLTYHYKRKEDLVEAVAMEQHKGYRKTAPAATLAELDASFRRKLAFQRGNAYYFRHYIQLAQISPRVHEHQQRVIHDLYEFYCETFRRFKAAGLMTQDAFPNQTRHLVQALVNLCLLGTLMEEGERLSCFWSLIWPTLTPRGREEYGRLSPRAGAEE